MYTLVGGLIELYRDRGVRRITILGLDGSGKTTLVVRWKGLCSGKFDPNPPIDVYRPTTGVNATKLEHGGLRLIFADPGGSAGMRKLWNRYYERSDLIVFVIDESDTSRYTESKDVLESVITSGKTRESPLLLLVNRDSQAASQRSRGIRDLFEPTVRMYYQPSQYAFMEVNPTERDMENALSWITSAVSSKRSSM